MLRIIAAFLACTAFAEEQISIGDIHPTQAAVGLSEVCSMFKDTMAKNSLKDAEQLKAFLGKQKPLKGVRGPGGEVFLVDGHHRASQYALMVENICGQDEACRAQKLRINFLDDCQDQKSSYAAFGKCMSAKNNIYLRDSSHAQDAFKPESKALPKNLRSLRDDPMRGLVGAMLYSLKIDSNDFVRYVEFKVADELRRHQCDETYLGLTNSDVDLKTTKCEKSSAEPAALSRIKSCVFCRPEVLKFLREAVETEHGAKADSAINQAQTTVQSDSPCPGTAAGGATQR